jgi:hypothetical protein
MPCSGGCRGGPDIAAEFFEQRIACPCGSAIVVHWTDYGYRHSDPAIVDVAGPVVRIAPKRRSPLFPARDVVDLLCQHCGRLLYQSEASRRGRSR